MKIFYADKEQYRETFRKMWRTIFQDSVSYEEFYFQTMYLKNKVLALEKNNEVAGMIHLNPYQICVNGTCVNLHYIVGVATLEKYRRQGIMRNMLIRCMKDMAKQGEAFTYLMPAKKQYYEPFDFVTAQQFQTKKIKGMEGKSELSVLREEDYEDACNFVNHICQHSFCIFTKFDLEYMKQLHKEVLSENGEILVRRESGHICGFCCYDMGRNTIYVRQIFDQHVEKITYELKRYFYGKDLELTFTGLQTGNGASIMVRILRLDLLFTMMKGKKKADIFICVHDPILEDQNQNFHIFVTEETCRIKKTKKVCKKTIDIGNLTKILFGFDCKELLNAYPEFQVILPLSPMMIGEII